MPQGSRFEDLTLADLWGALKDVSLFGLEVPTSGSELGRSTAHFVPLLSAMKLFTRCDGSIREQRSRCAPSPPRLVAYAWWTILGGNERFMMYSWTLLKVLFLVWQPRQCLTLPVYCSGGPGMVRCRYRGNHSYWPQEMNMLACSYAKRLPWERMPLYHEIHALANQRPSRFMPQPQALLNTPLCRMHPCSWFAIWWQPLYRIPDMPLDAKFLVYYTFELFEGPCTPHKLHVAGMLSGGVEVLNSESSSASGEHWLRVQDSSSEQGETCMHKLQEYLKFLHTGAKQLTCNCDHAIETYTPNGTLHEDEGHKDFIFLQRGRLGLANSAANG
jgi:hypothetical protein